MAEKPKYEIVGGWLVEDVGSCTCSGGSDFPHEPYCGIQPIGEIDDLLNRTHEYGQIVERALNAWAYEADYGALAIVAPDACGDMPSTTPPRICLKPKGHEGAHEGCRADHTAMQVPDSPSGGDDLYGKGWTTVWRFYSLESRGEPW